MDKALVINLLQNSGITVEQMDDTFVYFKDPSCIFPAFDTFFHYAWVVSLVLVAFIFLGWGLLYIKNGVKLSTFFNNIKTVFLVLMTLALVKPAVDFIYGKNLFASQCDTKKVSMIAVKELLDQRQKTFAKSDEAILFENFNVIDTGIKIPEE